MAAFVRQGVQAVQHIQVQIATGHFDWVNRVWLELQSRFPDNDTTSLATLRAATPIMPPPMSPRGWARF